MKKPTTLDLLQHILQQLQQLNHTVASLKTIPHEKASLDITSDQEKNRASLQNRLTYWYDRTPEMKLLPGPIPFSKLPSASLGEYYDTPHAINPAKVQVLDLVELRGKRLSEVGQYVHEKYGTTHTIAGLSFWTWASENWDEAKKLLGDDGSWKAYFIFGSLFCNSDGDWRAPYLKGGKRSGGWLGNDWRSGCRVVLLEN